MKLHFKLQTELEIETISVQVFSRRNNQVLLFLISSKFSHSFDFQEVPGNFELEPGRLHLSVNLKNNQYWVCVTVVV